jgi:peptidoglycan hydrolase-like protein with peptidoglycan-binding domain
MIQNMTTRIRKPIEHATETKETTVSDHYPFRHPLDTGDRGVLVMWAQSKLMKHGHYEGELDGRYDREVTLAVRKHQQQAGLKITGIIDRKTWDSL